MIIMRAIHNISLIVAFAATAFVAELYAQVHQEVTLTKAELQDKIKGGWAGQTIGVTYTKPSEAVFNGTMIPPYVQYEWGAHIVSRYMHNDDIYIDFTFMEVIEREGIDAPAESHAKAMANADYNLWHANQTARYNILNGIMPPASGNWRCNIHADCIDAQIEADFAGLMSPGMINAATDMTDRVSHIMNCGDSYYGAAFVAAMYSQAFVSDDVDFLVNESLKVIPEESQFYKSMKQVIAWHKQYPDDWRNTWFAIQKSDWAQTMHCPQGVFVPFNLDATTNAAYILVGLLYGEKDFFQTMEISMRCGLDSDCNPSNAAGILGTMIGYSNIPEYWLKPLQVHEDTDLRYTTTSLNRAYSVSFEHAVQNIVKNGGEDHGDYVVIGYQKPKPLPFEKAFPNIYPVKRFDWKRGRAGGKSIRTYQRPVAFTGTGFVVSGEVQDNGVGQDYVAELEVYLDGKLDAVRKLPADFHSRATELYLNLELPKSDHTFQLKWRNPTDDADISIWNVVIYSDELIKYDHR